MVVVVQEKMLTGRYELKEGAYEMNFNLLSENCVDGSYILWTGEPTMTLYPLQFIK
jgi:hypothetical protein